MSGKIVSIRMVVYKNQYCAVYNSVGLTASADKHRYYTLDKIDDHGIHAQHLLIISADFAAAYAYTASLRVRGPRILRVLIT